MPLSKEFYLEEIKSKYPNSYNESLKDLPIKDLEDMLDFLESALDKADGGPVGIEILFTEKVPAAPSQLVSESDIILGYRGDAAYRSGSLQSSSIGQGNVGSKASFGGGKGRDRSGRDEGAGGADRSKVTREQTRNQIKNQLGIKDPNLIQKTFNAYNRLPLGVKGAINAVAPVDLMKIFNIGNAINTGVNQIKNPDYNLEDMTLGMTDQPLPSDNLVADALTTPNEGKFGVSLNDYNILKNKGKFNDAQIQELQLNPKIDVKEVVRDIEGPLSAKDGGRVGLFMGGPALEGEALNIYNSMNAYGFSDQEIANALAERGLYTSSGSDSGTPPPQASQTLGFQGDDKPMIRPFREDPRVASAFEAFQADQQLQSMGIDNPFANEASLEGAYYDDMMDIDLSPGKQSKMAKFTEGLRSIPTKVKGMMDNPLTNAIGFAMNPVIGTVKGIASFANQMLPVNKRAIAENIAGNMGIAVDNIGRIVNTGNYQDPSNVMAGYNLNMLTDESFDKRIENISETLSDKYGLNKQQISDILSGKLTEEDFTDDKFKLPGTGKTTNLIKQLRSINIAKDRNKFIQETARKEAERKELERQLARAQKEIAAKGYTDYGSGGASEATQKSYEGPDGSYAGASTQDYGGGEKDGGIIGYRKGGLATMFRNKR